ncbi:hypothetical protein RJ640_030100 [Escallonia rubra]|uniref:Zinc finger LSD1-type domain-containing protein n=1 Tax=Escallonia rubra TaxID=112253 RepID=A0AA88U298_9ASTE|nr:hypothetical protein RJ640_030100 [Escallonia rubra]
MGNEQQDVEHEEEGPPPGWHSMPPPQPQPPLTSPRPSPPPSLILCSNNFNLTGHVISAQIRFRWFVVLAASCLVIREELDMFNVHVVRQSILILKLNIRFAAHQVGQVKCGSCTVLLMYPYGAQSVKCSSCRFVTEVGVRFSSTQELLTSSLAFSISLFSYLDETKLLTCQVLFAKDGFTTGDLLFQSNNVVHHLIQILFTRPLLSVACNPRIRACKFNLFPSSTLCVEANEAKLITSFELFESAFAKFCLQIYYSRSNTIMQIESKTLFKINEILYHLSFSSFAFKSSSLDLISDATLSANQKLMSHKGFSSRRADRQRNLTKNKRSTQKTFAFDFDYETQWP